jgi:hypothetical protein
MPRVPEPDDVDIVVDGRDADPDSIRETIEYIKEYKSRPGYADELEEARAILDSLRINSNDYGMADPADLLAHWRRCVEDLQRHGRDESNGSPAPAIEAESNEGR